MTHRKKYKGVIFDFNGVLFWDDAIQRESWRTFSTRLRKKPLSDEEIDLHVHGRNNKHTIEYLLGKPISRAQADQIGEQKETIYRQMCLGLGDNFSLSPGAINLLEKLSAQRVPFTIATASGEENVDFFWEHLALDTWFRREAIVFNDGKIPGKPAPDLFLRAARKLAIRPESCIVFEDSQAGIQAAHRAGIGYLVALGPSAKHDPLMQLEGVDQVIETLAEISVENLLA